MYNVVLRHELLRNILAWNYSGAADKGDGGGKKVEGEEVITVNSECYPFFMILNCFRSILVENFTFRLNCFKPHKYTWKCEIPP